MHEFDDQVPPDRPHRRWQAGDQMIRLGMRQISDQHRDAFPETLRAASSAAEEVKLCGEGVHRWLTSAGCRLVHHVVVYQREHVQQFERGAGLDDVSEAARLILSARC